MNTLEDSLKEMIGKSDLLICELQHKVDAQKDTNKKLEEQIARLKEQIKATGSK